MKLNFTWFTNVLPQWHEGEPPYPKMQLKEPLEALLPANWNTPASMELLTLAPLNAGRFAITVLLEFVVADTGPIPKPAGNGWEVPAYAPLMGQMRIPLSLEAIKRLTMEANGGPGKPPFTIDLSDVEFEEMKTS